MLDKFLAQGKRLGLKMPKKGTDKEKIDNLVMQIQQECRLCGRKYMVRPRVRIAGVTGQDDTLDAYYVHLINDAIRCSYHHVVAYVFDLYQIKDVCHYTNKLTFEYLEDSDSFKVYRKNWRA